MRPASCDGLGWTWAVLPPFDGPPIDFQGTLAHELGHTIGIGHSDECGAGTEGIMSSGNAATGADHGSLRWLKFDDIEAMTAKYGVRERTIRYRTAPGTDTSWSSEVTTGLKTLTPISIADADATGSVYNLAATYVSGNFTTHYGQVVLHKSVVPAVEPVFGATDPDSFTRQQPVIAFGTAANGKSYYVIAWYVETQTSAFANIVLAVREANGSTWSKKTLPTGDFHRGLGLSWVDDSNYFILTSRDTDNDPVYTAIDPVTLATVVTQPGATTSPLYQATYAAFGDPGCEHGTGGWCELAMSTSGPNGPCLGWIVGNVWVDGAFYFPSEYNYCYHVYGPHGLTRNPISGHYTGAFGQAGPYQWIYTKTAAFQAPSALVAINTAYWPIAIGSTRSVSSVMKWVFYAY